MKQNSIDVVGCIYNTRKSGDLIITKYVNKNEVHVEFVKTGYTTVARMGNIRKGNVRDRLLPNVLGVGVVGDEITCADGKHTIEYELWSGVLQRCYSEKIMKNTSHTKIALLLTTSNTSHILKIGAVNKSDLILRIVKDYLSI